MSLALSFTEAAPAPTHAEPGCRVCRSHTQPTYHQRSLDDAQGSLVHWMLPLKQLAKHSALGWHLPTPRPTAQRTCLGADPLQLASAHPGTAADLRTALAAGLLRLNFGGQQLRGYFRLPCLPAGGGQLWQLLPIGHA